MHLKDLAELLESTGYPVVYHHFKKPPPPPYVVYLFTRANNFGADNKVLAKFNHFQVELYTKNKQPEAEMKLEDALELAEIFYEKSELYLETEELYQIVYEIEM